LGPGIDGLLKALGNQTLANPTDGTKAAPQGSDDLVIGALPSGRGIRQQQDAGMGELAGRRFPDRDQAL
jgi:hypothetical protein